MVKVHETTAVTLRLGELTYKHRVQQGLSQVRLARELGVSRNTIIRLERAESRPGLDFAVRLARRLGFDLAAVVRGAGSNG